MQHPFLNYLPALFPPLHVPHLYRPSLFSCGTGRKNREAWRGGRRTDRGVNIQAVSLFSLLFLLFSLFSVLFPLLFPVRFDPKVHFHHTKHKGQWLELSFLSYFLFTSAFRHTTYLDTKPDLPTETLVIGRVLFLHVCRGPGRGLALWVSRRKRAHPLQGIMAEREAVERQMTDDGKKTRLEAWRG